MVKELDIQGFSKEVIASDKPVLVDFWAPWCGPCRTMAPVFVKVAEDYKRKLKFVKVNVQEHPELAQQYGVQGIPAFKLFDKGSVVGEFTGSRDEDSLKEIVDELLEKI